MQGIPVEAYVGGLLMQECSPHEENEMPQSKLNQVADAEIADSSWKSVYKVGAAAALLVVLVGLMEIIITFLPGGSTVAETVIDWFKLFEHNWFLGLRNLGLLNIVITVLGIPTYFALYGAHRRVNQVYAALAMIISFIGVAVFLATNRAFPMLELSSQYAAATTDAQRAMLEAVGQAMLSVGRSHTPGTFMGFLLSEVAGIMISVVMLRSKIFSKATAYVGILGFALLLIFEISSSFVPALFGVAMIIAMAGGILSMIWYILIARRLLQLGASE
jgi:hypothetical protein